MAGRRITSPALIVATALIVGAALAAGCATPSRAPVLDRSESISKPIIKSSGEYIVRANDSLYAIAWRYKLNYRDIARRNGIKPPYTIYPGQKLVLYGMKSEPTAVTEAPKTRPSTPTAAKSRPAVTKREASAPSPAKPAARPAAKPVPRPQPKPPAAQKTTRNQTARAGWRWPVNTQPARGFGRGNNGLDYVLPSGQQVVAAAAGQVVYAGPGLGGYRHLIIVEHSDQYLSAYNINVQPAVAEGSKIASGGNVCDIGSGSPATRRLHFEIRRNGTPVDPATIIGKR